MINPNEAPSGYIAIPAKLYNGAGFPLCDGCAFSKEHDGCHDTTGCVAGVRRDSEHVIFVMRETNDKS